MVDGEEGGEVWWGRGRRIAGEVRIKGMKRQERKWESEREKKRKREAEKERERERQTKKEEKREDREVL